MDGRTVVVVCAIGRDILSVPVENRSLRQLLALFAVERVGLVQIDALDTVATGTQHNRVIYYRAVGVTLAFPYRLVAEDDRAYRALYRSNGQVQRIDAILAVTRLVSVGIGVRTCHTAQVTQSVPTEIISFADRQRLLKMIFRRVLGQDQTVDIVAAGLRVRVLKLIRTCRRELCRIFLTGRAVGPGKAVLGGHCSVRLIDCRQIHRDMYVH